MRIAVGITGASGVIIGFRLLQELASSRHEVHCIITDNAVKVVEHELGVAYRYPEGATYYQESDSGAPLNSSSFLLDAMVVAPCSMKTLAAIAMGYNNSLVARAAENVLRTRSKLIIAPRETPLSASALENMLRLHRAGAVILPPVVAYYHLPKTVDDMSNFFVAKILDCLGIPNELVARWGVRGDSN